MKTIAIIFCILICSANCFGQKPSSATESFYSATIKGVVDSLPSAINSDVVIHATFKVIRDKNFCMLIIMESSLENPLLSTIAHSENDGDTLLFDLNNKRVYNFAENKSYWYIDKKLGQGNIHTDTIKKADTLIVLSKTLNKQINPSPTIKEMDKGITLYSARGFSFKYISSRISNISLSAIFDRCRAFVYTNQKTDYAY